MSHTVLRGKPTEAQLYLDSILDEIRIGEQNEGFKMRERDQINIAEIIFHCMKRNTNEFMMINGATGENFTKQWILEKSVAIARALGTRHAKEKPVLVLLQNHQYFAALYYALLFAGALPLMLDPNSTSYEVSYFNSLINPEIVFCEQDKCQDIKEAVKDPKVEIVVFSNNNNFNEFVKDHDNDIHNFKVSNAEVKSHIILLPTSGSTGVPKSAILTHEGLISQLPSLWMYNQKFTKSTKLAMLLSTAQWMTHTLVMTMGPVYQLPLLLTPMKPTTEHILQMLKTYKPTWSLWGPALALTLATAATKEYFNSLETLVITGSKLTAVTYDLLKDKLPGSTQLCDGYGMTEAHGFIALPDECTPHFSNGRVYNFFEYKIVDENGEELPIGQIGQLYLRSDRCIFKGYYKNESAFHDTVTADGWLKTGDRFYQSEDGYLFYVERIKLTFKYNNYHISPEELERVIGSVPGVKECVVCGLDIGPTAAVIRIQDVAITEQQIHDAINDKLSDYKRLQGGIVFVNALPRTPNGKVNRPECLKLLQRLTKCC